MTVISTSTVSISLPGQCSYCSVPLSVVVHDGPCPRVKAIEYHPNGAVKRIEFVEQPAPVTQVFC